MKMAELIFELHEITTGVVLNLMEIDNSKYQKMLIYGDSGAGKTCLAAGFPTPIWYCDFDGKLSSAAKFYKDDQERLKNIEIKITPKNSFQDFIDLCNEITRLEAKGELPFKTLVIDSFTTMSRKALQHCVKTIQMKRQNLQGFGEKATPNDYGWLKTVFISQIPGILALPANIIFLGHVSTSKDENSGEILRDVMGEGSFGTEMPIYFEEVYLAYVDNKKNHMLQTKPDYKYSKLRTQKPGIPDRIPSSYNEIIKY